MFNHDLFDVQRWWNLTMIQIKVSAKTICQNAAVIALILLLIPTSNTSMYIFFLYVGGFVVTSRIFNDLHDPQEAHLFLMLPCSNLERFLSKWFLSSVGYAIGLLVLCYAFSLLFSVLTLFIFKHPLNLAQSNLWIEIWKYIILQSVILLGAITFKNHALVKTALVLGCFFLVLSAFSLMITMVMFFPGHLQQGAAMIEASLYGWNFVFWVVLAPICWYITYLRIAEYELK